MPQEWPWTYLPFLLLYGIKASNFWFSYLERYLFCFFYRTGVQTLVKQLLHGPVTKLAVLISGFSSRENRRHRRAKIKWPIVMKTPDGLVDGQTQNLSLGGAFVCCAELPNLQDDFLLVMTSKDRLILVNAEVVWSNGSKSSAKSTAHGMGIRFTKILSNDRTFLSGIISNHI